MPQKPKSNPRRTNGAKRNAIRRRVLAYYDTCYICGQAVDKTLKTPHPLSAEVDEVIPVSRGGSPYDWNNVRLAHRACNRLKSTHSADYARVKIRGASHTSSAQLVYKTSKW